MLYVFGDSYVKSDSRPDWSYLSLVQKELDTPEQNFGLVGSSLDYTFARFEEQRNNFVEGDIILITLTVQEKVTFFPDRPTLSHSVMSRHFFGTVDHTNEEKQAMQAYFKHLHNPEIVGINVINFLHSVNDITQKKKLHTVVLNSIAHNFDSLVVQERFPAIHLAKGCLADPTKAEISDQDLFNFFEFQMYTNDPRPFHYSKENHRILADSIISSIKHNTAIDLETIFKKNIFGRDQFREYMMLLANKS